MRVRTWIFTALSSTTRIVEEVVTRKGTAIPALIGTFALRFPLHDLRQLDDGRKVKSGPETRDPAAELDFRGTSLIQCGDDDVEVANVSNRRCLFKSLADFTQ